METLWNMYQKGKSTPIALGGGGADAMGWRSRWIEMLGLPAALTVGRFDGWP
jgi:hypothetical protein